MTQDEAEVTRLFSVLTLAVVGISAFPAMVRATFAMDASTIWTSGFLAVVLVLVLPLAVIGCWFPRFVGFVLSCGVVLSVFSLILREISVTQPRSDWVEVMKAIACLATLLAASVGLILAGQALQRREAQPELEQSDRDRST